MPYSEASRTLTPGSSAVPIMLLVKETLLLHLEVTGPCACTPSLE